MSRLLRPLLKIDFEDHDRRLRLIVGLLDYLTRLHLHALFLKFRRVLRAMRFRLAAFVQSSDLIYCIIECVFLFHDARSLVVAAELVLRVCIR